MKLLNWLMVSALMITVWGMYKVMCREEVKDVEEMEESMHVGDRR